VPAHDLQDTPGAAYDPVRPLPARSLFPHPAGVGADERKDAQDPCQAPEISLALENTESIIPSVSTPVKVFCWLGW